jgi:hypothetical protein
MEQRFVWCDWFTLIFLITQPLSNVRPSRAAIVAPMVLANDTMPNASNTFLKSNSTSEFSSVQPSKYTSNEYEHNTIFYRPDNASQYRQHRAG